MFPEIFVNLGVYLWGKNIIFLDDGYLRCGEKLRMQRYYKNDGKGT